MVRLIGLCVFLLCHLENLNALECFGSTCDVSHPVCKVEFANGIPTGGQCDKQHQHGHHPQCGHTLPQHGHCHCDDVFCMNLVYTLTTTTVQPLTTVAQPMTTMPATNAPTTQSAAALACTDDEDSSFTCLSYQNAYNLCASTSVMLTTIAKTRCKSFCGICGTNTPPPQKIAPSGTPTGTLHPCIDHHPKCADSVYQSIMCKSTIPATKEFAIASCPLACNYCTEYFAQLTALG